MKRVICPRCYKDSIQIVTKGSIIPIQFSPDDDKIKLPENAFKKPKKAKTAEELLKLHNQKTIFQCSACGASYKIKKNK